MENEIKTQLPPVQEEQVPQGLANRLNKTSVQSSSKFPLKIVIISLVVLLFLTGIGLVFFTNLKYKIPFLRPDTEELVTKMYQGLSELDGVDFSLTYDINIGERDSDAKAVEEELENVEGSDSMEFMSGNFLKEMSDNMLMSIPENFEADFTFAGSGFSLSGREDSKNRFPDVGIHLFGEGKFGSMTMSLDMEGRAVNDNIYYKASDFPYMDITKGHQGEWIQLSPDSDFIAEVIPEYDEKQKEIANEFKKFILQTQEYNILSFYPTGEIVEIEGKSALIFDVEVNAENIPSWLEAAKAIAEEQGDEYFAFLEADKYEYTGEEKIEMVENINKFLHNMKFSIGLNMKDGSLMYLKSLVRFVPSSDLEKFDDKQINISLMFKLWNHNSPEEIDEPDEYIRYEEIERQELNMTKDEYGDYKQNKRITNVRRKLAEYHLENKEFPEELSEITKAYTDYNTDKLYDYTTNGVNYTLKYVMNDDPKEVDYFRAPDTSYYSGTNTADRFSLIADQLKEDLSYSDKYTTDVVLFNVMQFNTIKFTRDKLKKYYSKNNKYPDTLDELVDFSNLKHYSFYYSVPTGYLCEDLSKGAFCDYVVKGNDYELSVNFDINYNDIKAGEENYDIVISTIQNFNRYGEENKFYLGENKFNKNGLILSEDTDLDGLSDEDEIIYGTDINNPDTDGDGYLDGEEVDNGHNPLGSGLLE